MVAILEQKPLGDSRRKGYLAAVFAHGPAQDGDRVVVPAPSHVIPPLDGDSREPNVASRDGMTPGLLGKRANRGLERTASGGRTQERAHYREPKVRPQDARRLGRCLSHHVSSQGRGRNRDNLYTPAEKSGRRASSAGRRRSS